MKYTKVTATLGRELEDNNGGKVFFQLTAGGDLEEGEDIFAAMTDAFKTLKKEIGAQTAPFRKKETA